MTRKEEARAQITEWVFEGKKLEEIERLSSQSRLAGALSPADLEFEYYQARTGLKISRPKKSSIKLARTLGVFAIILGLAAMTLMNSSSEREQKAGLQVKVLAVVALVLGATLILTPKKASEREK